jgi:hypothetical protein
MPGVLAACSKEASVFSGVFAEMPRCATTYAGAPGKGFG